LEIGYPKVAELEAFNQSAAIRWIWEKERRFRQKREAKWAKFQPKRVIKGSKEDAEDVQLMELVSGGNTKAFVELRKRHYSRLEGTVKKILKSNSAVQDITERVFIQVWKYAPEYVPTAKVTTWLTEIAKNLALNEKKRAGKEEERIEFSHVSEDGSKGKKSTPGGSVELIGWRAEDPSMEDGEVARRLPHVSEDGSAGSDVAQALSRLSPSERRIIEARFGIGGSKRKDRGALADELGITASEVEDLESEALNKMRQFMSL
jgi:RNA polymerase sigma factor (sigma-70 family)